MSSWMSHVHATQVPQGQAGVFWMGQAGFLFKTSKGKIVVLDPYLSNCCERYFGFRRLMPYLCTPYDLTPDLLLVSHSHYDHFDVDTVPLLMRNPRTELLGAKDIRVECDRLHVNERVTLMEIGDRQVRDEVTITALPCDHGELAPDALGFLLEIEGKTIYIMGDTAYRPDLLENKKLHETDLLILPINGAFGNLNEAQATEVVATLNPKKAIPCHFWNFAEHGGNPNLFLEAMKEKGLEEKIALLAIGGEILI